MNVLGHNGPVVEFKKVVGDDTEAPKGGPL